MHTSEGSIEGSVGTHGSRRLLGQHVTERGISYRQGKENTQVYLDTFSCTRQQCPSERAGPQESQWRECLLGREGE